MTEESALTFHALSYFFALRPRGSPRLNFFLAGLFLGLAAQFRQPFGLSVIFIGLCVLWRPQGLEASFRTKFGLLLFAALGTALPEAVCSGYFLAKGRWQEYFEASYLYNFLYMRGELDPDVLGPGLLLLPILTLLTLRACFGMTLNTAAFGVDAVLQKCWRMIQATGPYLLSPAIAIPLLWWLPRRLRRVGALMVAAFVCDLMAISLGGRYYEHYYLQVAISSSFLLGLSLQAIYEGLRPRSLLGKAALQPPLAIRRLKGLRAIWSLLCVLTGALVLRVCFLSTAGAVKQYIRSYKAELQTRRQPGGELKAEQGIGKAIRTVTRPDERILLLGASPTSVYFAGQRLAGSRYYHLSPFFRQAFAKSMRERHRERFMSDLKTRRPVLVILAREERQIYFAGMDVIEKSAAAFLTSYLEENYVPLEKSYSRPWRREGWTWYRRICTFLIRKDMTEEVARRLQEEDAAGR